MALAVSTSWKYIIAVAFLSITVNLTNDIQALTFRPNESYQVMYDRRPLDDGAFLIPQCHSTQHNLTIQEIISTSTSQDTSSSVGDVIGPGPHASDDLTLILSSPEDQPVEDFTIYCVTQVYEQEAPVPGGCSLEFNLLNDPNIHTWYDGYKIWIQYQYAAAYKQSTLCTVADHWPVLTYDLYFLHYENLFISDNEEYVEKIRKFIKPNDIINNGHLISTFKRDKALKPSVILTSYPDQPVLVALVVTDTRNQMSAAYVSTMSYGCDKHRDDSSHPCSVQWYLYLATTIISVMSLPLVVCSYRLFHYQMFYNGAMSGLLLSYIGLSLGNVSLTGMIAGCVVLSLIAGFLWLLFWCSVKKAHLAVMLTAANAGFLYASTVFFTPLVNFQLLHNGWEIWILALVAVLLCVLIIVLKPKVMNIVFCTFFCSYAVLAVISLVIKSTLHHIIVESLRRATIYQYYDVQFISPFLPKDYVLVILWAVTWIASSLIQYKLSKNMEEFPDPPKLPSFDCLSRFRQQSHGNELTVLDQQEDHAMGFLESCGETYYPWEETIPDSCQANLDTSVSHLGTKRFFSWTSQTHRQCLWQTIDACSYTSPMNESSAEDTDNERRSLLQTHPTSSHTEADFYGSMGSIQQGYQDQPLLKDD